MKRKFKKALSIAVAASLALSMPVSVMAEEATETTEQSKEEKTEFQHDPNAIIEYEGKVVEKTGDIVVNNDNAIQATNGSKVTVTGNVTANGEYSAVYNSASEVTVKGNVTSDAQQPSGMIKCAVGTDKGGKTEITGDVISGGSGVRSSGNSSVNVHGSIKSEEYGIDSSNSSIKVDGNVTSKSTGVYGENSSISVKGTVSSTINGVNVTKNHGDEDDVVNIEKGIKVTGKPAEGQRINIEALTVNKEKSKGKLNVKVNGDVESRTSADDDSIRVSGSGIVITNRSGEASVEVNGNVSAYGDNKKRDNSYVSGIWIIGEGDKTQSTDVTVNGDVTAISNGRSDAVNINQTEKNSNVTVNGNVTATSQKWGTGISLQYAYEGSESNTNVNGDVRGSAYGLKLLGIDGKANVTVNGTLSGGEAAIIISKATDTEFDDNDNVTTNTYGDKRSGDITVWKVTSDTDTIVRGVDYKTDYTNEDFKEENTANDKAAEELLKNINYIIRTDKVDNGTIKLSNTRLISGFDTARETEEITIKVQASDGYKVDSVKNGDAVLRKNSDGTYTLTVPRGGGVQLSAVLSAIQKSESSSSGSSGSSSSSRPGVTSTNVQTIPSASGATVATTTSDSNGTHNTNAVVKIADKQATVSTSEQTGNGNSIIIRNVNGDVAGATFTGVGTVSADGKSIATADGQVHAVTQAPMLVIKTGDQSVGCFVDLTTGAPLATGKTEVYYQLGADGQMYAHWVNPMGFFYTGTVVMNGHTIEFNEQGVMIDVR